MPAGGDREAFVAADHNAEMIEHVERFPSVRDRSIFVGDPEDVIDARFGPDLPVIREWTERHYDFAGYIPGFDPEAAVDRAALGYGDEPLCVVSVGGSGVGASLLARALESLARRARARAGPAHAGRDRPAHRPGEPARDRRRRGRRLRARAAGATSRSATSPSSRAA